MSNTIYSYTEFMKDKQRFRSVDYKGMNRFDTPASLYFKLIFYFSDNYGLLGTDARNLNKKNVIDSTIGGITPAYTKEITSDQNNTAVEKPTSARGSVFSNTALNFLLLNDELERAELLKKFILLLSSINCDSPWYFQTVDGLDAALERKMFSDGEVKLEDKPRQINIKCLKDAFDNRIGTLLDLYRSICYSYQMKREVVPANLRKFNMAVLVFNAPIRGKGGKSGDKNNRIIIPDTGYSYYIPSVKMIELRNCEIDYNSSKSAWSSLGSEEPFQPEYTITINYDDAYESRYNEVMQNVVSDMINIDIAKERSGSNDADKLEDIAGHGETPYNDVGDLKIKLGTKNYWLGDDTLDEIISTQITKLYLGNIYNFSLAGSLDAAKKLISGDIVGFTADEVRKYSTENAQVTNQKVLYDWDKEQPTKEKAEGQLDRKPEEYDRTASGQLQEKADLEDRVKSPEKLPGYELERMTMLAKYNEAKSIRNSL